MNILTCCTIQGPHPETRDALIEHLPDPYDWKLEIVDPKDSTAYARILSDYWARGEDFAVVEPDIVVRADVIDAMHNCPCEYGCFPYPWLTNIGPALGCTWFRAPILERHPDAMQYVLNSRVGWQQLDVILMRHVLAQRGEQPHVHLPPVEHLNPRKQLREDADPAVMTTVPLR